MLILIVVGYIRWFWEIKIFCGATKECAWRMSSACLGECKFLCIPTKSAVFRYFFTAGTFQFSHHYLTCKHLAKFSSECSWMSIMWFIRLTHFATITLPFPSCVDDAHQYMWFVIDLIHSDNAPQSFWAANLRSLALKPANKYKIKLKCLPWC